MFKLNYYVLLRRLSRVAEQKHWEMSRYVGHVGAVFLDYQQYYGYALSMYSNAQGGEKALSRRMTAKEMDAFLDGIMLGATGLPT